MNATPVQCTTRWFIPVPEEPTPRRALVHLGLNGADRHYRELVVPGIGSVWFVRQLSWAVAGIALSKDLPQYRPSVVANAVEALACKYYWDYIDEEDTERIHGVRAFARYPDAWGFTDLAQTRYFVQNTYRQNTVRALSDRTGLGFTTGGRLFNAMVLTKHGEDLARLFLEQRAGRGRAYLRSCLSRWIAGDEDAINGGTVQKALDPWRPSKHEGGEGSVVLDRLQAHSPESSEDADPQRRARLLKVFQELDLHDDDEGDLEAVLQALRSMPSPHARAQAEHIRTAVAYTDVAALARRLIHRCAEELGEPGALEATLKDLAQQLENDIEALRTASSAYLDMCNISGAGHADAGAFAEQIIQHTSNDKVLELVVRRDGVILQLAGEMVVEPGPLFKSHKTLTDKPDDALAEAGTLRSFRLRQLLYLWEDCHAQ